MRSQESRVLIVEDNLATLFALQAMFRAAGWQVGTAKTAVSALASLDPGPDWIVLDLDLADGAALDVLRHVRGLGISSRVAAILGGQDAAGLEVVLHWKPDLVLAKPLNFVRLIEACGCPAELSPLPPGRRVGSLVPHQNSATLQDYRT